MLAKFRFFLSLTVTHYRRHGPTATLKKIALRPFKVIMKGVSQLPGRPTGEFRKLPAISEAQYHQPSITSALVARWQNPAPRTLFLVAQGNKSVSLPVAGGCVTTSLTDEPVEALRLVERGEVDVLILHGCELTDDLKHVLFSAQSLHIPAGYVVDNCESITRMHVALTPAADDHPSARDDGIAFGRLEALRACTFVLMSPDIATGIPGVAQSRIIATPPWSTLTVDPTPASAMVLRQYQRVMRPRVSIVGILYNKAAEIRPALKSYFEQTYEGEIEITFVDDRSPDNSAEIVESYVEKWRADHPDFRAPTIHIIRNDKNVGNCHSRNRGIAAATGDIIIIIDADCVLNRDFVLRHVDAHAFGDCEVVIGPMNIESSGADPEQLIRTYESSPELACEHAALQDRSNRTSFLNCITRNFSIKREAITENLFDPLFTYSADPSSGFGWEDVEMGYRLYLRGARIKFVQDAISVHVSPLAEVMARGKPLRSMKNFRRLFEKHPELALVARSWATDTYRKICAWGEAVGAQPNDDWQHVGKLLGIKGPVPPLHMLPRRYKVLTYRWHVPHQYELYKLPFDFTLVTGTGSPMTDQWDWSQRPLPANVRFMPLEEINARDYDFAILHFDENVLSPQNTNGVIGQEWGKAFQWFCENLDLPKVAICHGTPQFYGQYNIDYAESNLLQTIEVERDKLVRYVAEMPIVCNSHQAMREWRFLNARVIWHGLDPADFPPATYEKGIVSPLGPLVISRPHYRGYFLYRSVFDGHYDELRPETLRVPEPHLLYTGNTYARAKYRNYVDEIRRHSVYFNPTKRSPMPRARAEPMMCGVVTVSAKNHDVDLFIKNGVNGFYSDDADELRDQLRFLLRNPDDARKIGAAGRALATDIFNSDRFLAGWQQLVSELMGQSTREGQKRALAARR